jgi:hypothetical protein
MQDWWVFQITISFGRQLHADGYSFFGGIVNGSQGGETE